MAGKVEGGYGLVRFREDQPAFIEYLIFCFVGDIPEEMTLDHLVRVRNCVNPKHLEPVNNNKKYTTRGGLAAQNAKTLPEMGTC